MSKNMSIDGIMFENKEKAMEHDLEIFNSIARRLKLICQQHDNCEKCAFYSHNLSKCLASFSAERAPRLWNVKRGK